MFLGSFSDAIKKGNLPLVRKLIHMGQDVNQYFIRYTLGNENIYHTPLYAASYDLKLQIMKALLLAGANPNLPTKPDNITPLNIIAYSGGNLHTKLEAIKLLLKFGANPNIRDKKGYNALYNAVENGNIDVVRLLLKHGADVNIHNVEDGETPLHYAVSYHKLDIARLLIQHGANINALSKKKYRPVDLAIKYFNFEMLRLLLLAGANKTGLLNFTKKWKVPNNALNLIDPSRVKARNVILKWRGTVQKSNNKFVKNQMSKNANKVPVSNKTVNLVTLENFKPGNVGLKVTKKWIQKNGTPARKEYYLKPSTLQNPRLAGKPWINVKGKGNVRSMARLATVMIDPETRLRILRRNVSPVVFTSPKPRVNWNAPN